VRENTKSGKQREIPINDDLLAVLKERRKVMHIGGYVFTRRGKRLNDVRTALRHTFASWFMINGGDIYRLQISWATPPSP
jgi:integrase